MMRVGLADKTGRVDAQLIQAAAAALNIQVIRDLPQFWNVSATVEYLPDAGAVPVGVWPVFLVDRLPPGEGGFHSDSHHRPFAKVIASSASADWTIDASHEVLEMLVDPAGNRLQTSRAIKIMGSDVQDDVGQFEYVVEACDPCEDNRYAYSINGIGVSDFITPHYYDPSKTPGTRYSFTGSVERPRQLLPGGYISFIDPEKDELEQITWLEDKPVLVDLGAAGALSLREYIDNRTMGGVLKQRHPNQALAEWCDRHRTKVRNLAVLRGKRFQ
jgi:hypothetical protein